MPTYDYQCSDCGHRFEEFQSMKADPLTTCPVCKTDSLRRLIGAGAGLIFKGSGFYITDYKNNGNGKVKTKSGESTSTTDSNKESSKDTATKSTGNTDTKKESAA